MKHNPNYKLHLRHSLGFHTAEVLSGATSGDTETRWKPLIPWWRHCASVQPDRTLLRRRANLDTMTLSICIRPSFSLNSCSLTDSVVPHCSQRVLMASLCYLFINSSSDSRNLPTTCIRVSRYMMSDRW